MWVRMRAVGAVCLGVVLITIAHWSISGLDPRFREQAVSPVPPSYEGLREAVPHSLLTEQVLFFNRVPKTGSEMFVLLLQWLQGRNGFRHVRLKNTVRRYLTDEEQMNLAEEMGERLYESAVPAISFDRHVHFTNFSLLGLKMPLCFSGVRDPVQKLASRFYYARATPRPDLVLPNGVSPPPAVSNPPRYSTLEECVRDRDPECTFLTGNQYDLSIPYFCGHHQFCRQTVNWSKMAAGWSRMLLVMKKSLLLVSPIWKGLDPVRPPCVRPSRGRCPTAEGRSGFRVGVQDGRAVDDAACICSTHTKINGENLHLVVLRDGHRCESSPSRSSSYLINNLTSIRELNNPEALATARRHVEDWYPVVAVLEEVNATLKVLESRMPIFFSGITEMYFEELEAPHLNRNRQRPPSIDPEVERELRQNLTLEYDFYNFLRQRLLRQFDTFESQGL